MSEKSKDQPDLEILTRGDHVEHPGHYLARRVVVCYVTAGSDSLSFDAFARLGFGGLSPGSGGPGSRAGIYIKGIEEEEVAGQAFAAGGYVIVGPRLAYAA